MSLSRPLVAFLGVGILGIAGVGLGAGATFTDSTHSLQTISVGKIDVTLSADKGTLSNNNKTLTLPPLLLTGSSFQTEPIPITITNNGTLAATEVLLTVTDPLIASSTIPNPNAALRNALSVCITSPAGVTPPVFDGLVNSLQLVQSTTTPGKYGIDLGGSIAPNGGKDYYMAEFYAGNVTTACGPSGDVFGLPSTAQGGIITPSINITYNG